MSPILRTVVQRLLGSRPGKAWAVLLVALLVTGARPPDAPVADAAQRGDTEDVHDLLRGGADVNAAQGDGMTALHWAAERGAVDLVRTLLFAGANPSASTRNGDYTPLHLAAKVGRSDVIVELLDAGGKIDATTSTGVTPLHFAAQSARPEAVQVLIDRGAAVDPRESAYDQTPLMWAAAFDHVEVVRSLLERGADFGLFSQVEDIAQRGREDEGALRRRNARVDAMVALRKAEVEGRDAALEDLSVVARTIEEFQAQPQEDEDEPKAEPEPEPLSYNDLVWKKGGLTPLHFAAREGNTRSAMALLEAGADPDRVSEGDLSTPMLLATINGHFDLARELLNRGADPNIFSEAGATPLYTALNLNWHPKSIYPQPQAFKQQENTYLDLMRALLEAGADPNVRLEKSLWYMEYNFERLSVEFAGATPFWRAAYAQDVPAMKLLVEFGADVSIPTRKMPERRFRGFDASEDTDPSGLPPVPLHGPAAYPIHAATGIGFGEGYAGGFHRGAPNSWLAATRYLVEELGADVNARDVNGFSPLHHAASRGDVPVIEYLLEHGGDPLVVSRRGLSTADMANSPVQRVPVYQDALDLLMSHGAINNNRCQVC